MQLLRSWVFRNLLIGLTISQLGDVAFMVALPWIVLQMTGSSAVLGSILVAVAIPRAGLMLLGGAVSDRLPAKTILIVGNVALTLCVAAVAFLAFRHALALWMLYILAVIFGIADAFTIPAIKVLVPAIVSKEQITAANSLLQSATQVCLLAGGAVAGILIQRFSVVPALAIDAGSFLFLIAAIAVIKTPPDDRIHTSSLLASVRDGLAYAAREPMTRTLVVVIAVVNFCLTGATQIGLVTLIQSRFGSAAYFGGLVTTIAIGSLIGIALAGAIRLPSNVSSAVLGAAAVLGLFIGALALPLPIAAIFALLLFCGAIAGFVNVHIVSALQKNVAPDKLGRVMSLVSLAALGVTPISMAVSGVIAQVSLALLFASAGAALLVVAAVGGLLLKNRLDVGVELVR
jgi:hypothetical protein